MDVTDSDKCKGLSDPPVWLQYRRLLKEAEHRDVPLYVTTIITLLDFFQSGLIWSQTFFSLFFQADDGAIWFLRKSSQGFCHRLHWVRIFVELNNENLLIAFFCKQRNGVVWKYHSKDGRDSAGEFFASAAAAAAVFYSNYLLKQQSPWKTIPHSMCHLLLPTTMRLWWNTRGY